MTRPHLQLHLSTLLMVTLLAAGLVWLNVRRHYIGVYIERGWPLSFEWRYNLPTENLRAWNPAGFAANALCALSLIALAAVTIEYLTRRVKRKAAP